MQRIPGNPQISEHFDQLEQRHGRRIRTDDHHGLGVQGKVLIRRSLMSWHLMGARAKPGAGRRDCIARCSSRTVVERQFILVKQWRGIATPYEKLSITYRATVVLCAVVGWLRTLHTGDVRGGREVPVAEVK